MVKLALQVKANLENVTNLTSSGEDFRWYIKAKCVNCGEETPNFIYACEQEKSSIRGSRGEANVVLKCKLCSRENSIGILPMSQGSYQIDQDFQTLIVFECRGVELTDFSPRVGFVCEGVDSGATFEVDLTEGEWVDYDEKASASVGVYELEHRFVRA